MDPSLNMTEYEQVDDAYSFLNLNQEQIIEDLKTVFTDRIVLGHKQHKGHALNAFRFRIKEDMIDYIKNTIFDYDTDPELRLIIFDDDDIKELLNKIIKESIGERNE